MTKSLKNNTSRKIKFDYDLSDFEKNVQRFIDDVQNETVDILRKVTPDFVSQAAKYTPPNIGKNSIEKKYYTRPILVLSKLIAGEYNGITPSNIDIGQYKKKMKFKVLYTKSGVKKGTAFAYCKTISQAKKAAKIVNRGISRVMWGKNLETQGIKPPVSIQRLINRSPNISRYNYNSISLVKQADETGIEIINKVKGIERYSKEAERQGYKKVFNSITRELKKIAQREVEL